MRRGRTSGCGRHLRDLIDPKIAEHRGRIVKNTGDGFLAEFASVVDAVRCAVEVQRGMAERNAAVPPEKRIEFRIGINLGDVIAEERRHFRRRGQRRGAAGRRWPSPAGYSCPALVHEHVRDRLPSPLRISASIRSRTLRGRCGSIGFGTMPPLSHPSPTSRRAVALPDKPSIAVLPFANMSGDPEQEYFADGMVEEIITALSRIRWLFVIARNSSFTYKGQDDRCEAGRA